MSNKLNTIINHFESNSFKHFKIIESDAKIELCKRCKYGIDDSTIFDEIKNITQNLEILKIDYSIDLDGTIILDEI